MKKLIYLFFISFIFGCESYTEQTIDFINDGITYSNDEIYIAASEVLQTAKMRYAENPGMYEGIYNLVTKIYDKQKPLLEYNKNEGKLNQDYVSRLLKMNEYNLQKIADSLNLDIDLSFVKANEQNLIISVNTSNLATLMVLEKIKNIYLSKNTFNFSRPMIYPQYTLKGDTVEVSLTLGATTAKNNPLKAKINNKIYFGYGYINYSKIITEVGENKLEGYISDTSPINPSKFSFSINFKAE